MLRRGQGAAAGAPPAAVAVADNGPAPVDIGKELGMAVVRGEQGAFGKLMDLAKTQLAAFNTNRVGLTDSARGELASRTFAPLYAAFKVIEEAALMEARLQAMP